jgi:ketosteroid isomerase-like protein
MLVILALALGLAAFQTQSPEDDVLSVIQRFEQGLAARDLSKIEPLMAANMVAFENGHRNDGWQDFRDNHLVPEMKEPAPPMKSELVLISVTPGMAWGYTKTTMTLTRKNGEKVGATLWSVYVLEKREGNWKIAMLDWSFKVPPPAASK